ncbi:MAG: T9SS type A sorting domain-containing protein [Bacteroidota bacterium]|nr:T9SS type A sorting domain-containing protein [Bacteroidota bacterium]
MNKITCLRFVFIGTIGFSQSMPIDFEVAEDDAWGAFNGTVATVLQDPTDASNTVLEMIGAGVDFDGAALNLDTYVDLSDDANNTISLRIWAPDATTRTHLLKLEGGSSGATELTFTTTMMGWQTVNVDFGPGLGTEYPIIVIFTDSTPGNTATGTYYIDDINGPNGAVIPNTPVPATAAPNPTAPAAEVLSIYSDTGGYTNTWNADYSFGSVNTTDLGNGSVNNTLLFNLAAGGWGQGTNTVTDISAYNYLQFDYWADSNSTEIRFFLIDDNGGVVEYWYEIGGSAPQEAIANDTWTHVEIPLSFFEMNAPNNQAGTGGFSKANFLQWKIDASDNLQSDFVYVDNIYFSQNPVSAAPTAPTVAAPSPTAPASEVISMFSNVYTDVPVDTWNTSWSAATLMDVQIAGDDVKFYSNLNFNGIETVTNSIDATTPGMMFFNMDVWTPDATEFRIKLVDFLGDGFGGAGDTEAELIFTPAQGSWETISIPLADFAAAGMTSFTDISQVIIAAQPAGTATVYVDNVYFSQNAPNSTGGNMPVVAAPAPTAPQVDVISLFSNVYNDVPVDTWNTSWSAATFSDVQVAGDDVKLYENLDFNGIETVASPINATAAGMMYFNMDIWTPDATLFRIKLVDFLGDGFGGAGDTEAELAFTPATGQWVTLSIPLSDFSAGGMTSFSDINQFIISAQPTGGATVYVDNVYFSVNQVASNQDVVLNEYTVYPNPSVNQWNITSSNQLIEEIAVFDLTGKMVMSNKVNSESITIDASSLRPGIYIARVTSASSVSSLKLVKE